MRPGLKEEPLQNPAMVATNDAERRGAEGERNASGVDKRVRRGLTMVWFGVEFLWGRGGSKW